MLMTEEEAGKIQCKPNHIIGTIGIVGVLISAIVSDNHDGGSIAMEVQNLARASKYCVGSNCAHWQWWDKATTEIIPACESYAREPITTTVTTPNRRGYCGLSGVPKEG